MVYRLTSHTIAVLLALFLSSCATNYTTPGGGVSIAEISDEDIKALFEREPASPFAARLAIARVQAQGYVSQTNEGYGQGGFSVVTTRDIESESHFETIQSQPLVAAVAPLTRLLLPGINGSIKDLRLSAATLKADMLLVYSVDTAFTVEGKSFGPLSLISLGFIPNKKAHVTATISGALVDVRTGFIYGVAEASAKEQQSATVWSTETAIDSSRLAAEGAAFTDFISEFVKLWSDVTRQYASQS